MNKKVIISIIAVILLVAVLGTVLVACNKEDYQKRLEKKGYHIVMTVHDEVVLEVPEGESSVEEVCSIMKENPSWLNNFPSACEGYECQFYKKE